MPSFIFQVARECETCMADLNLPDSLRVDDYETCRNSCGEVEDPAWNEASLVLEVPNPEVICMECGIEVEIEAVEQEDGD